MNRSIAFSMLLFSIVAISGCIFSSDDKKEVKKGSVKGKLTMVITGEPLANVKVMLVNLDVKVDTVNYANNLKAFVDSTYTGTDGTYAITGIAPGRYGVIPVFEDSTATYKFSLAQGGTGEITVNEDARTIDFIVEKTSLPGADTDWFEIKLTFKNRPYGRLIVSVFQRYWLFFIPYWHNQMYYTLQRDEDLSLRKSYGFTLVMSTLENYYSIHGIHSLTNNENDFYFVLGFPLWDTPAYSEFQYDYTTKTVTRIK